MLFNINYQLCKEFPAFTPYDLDRKKYHDVIVLYSDVRKLQIRQKKLKDPDRVIRRRAGDDWF